MRRRQPPPLEVQPPKRLLWWDVTDWLDQVDPDGYDADEHRNRRNNVPYGEPRISRQQWRDQEAYACWLRARLDHAAAHGWPGQATPLALLQDARRQRRAA